MQGNFEHEENELSGAKGLWERDSGLGGDRAVVGVILCINVDERSFGGCGQIYVAEIYVPLVV